MSTRDDQDFHAEVDAHLELEADRLVAEGLGPDDARAAALKQFGNVTSARERFHEATHRMWLARGRQDVRYGLRTLARSPSFAATAIVTLAVALALTAGAFTVFNAYVLRPFAVRDPAALCTVVWRARDAGGRSLRWHEYEAIRARRDLFTDVLAASTRYVSSKGRPLAAELVSDTYFEALGPAFALGRPLGLGDQGSASADSAVVLSHDAWARFFARDPHVIGREVDVNGRSFVVVGVLGPQFAGLHTM